MIEDTNDITSYRVRVGGRFIGIRRKSPGNMRLPVMKAPDPFLFC